MVSPGGGAGAARGSAAERPHLGDLVALARACLIAFLVIVLLSTLVIMALRRMEIAR